MFSIDSEKLRTIGESLTKAADSFSITYKNIIWSTELSLNEQLMLKDVEMEIKMNELNVDKSTLGSMFNVYRSYGSIISFYNHDSMQILKERELGFERDTKYDPTLSIEDAFLKYLGCTQEEAKRIHDIYSEAEQKWQDYVTKLREKYNGSLGQLVGKNESDYDEIANNVRKSIDEFGTLVKEYLGDKFTFGINDPNKKNH